MLNREHYRFAKQCGATHVVVHLTDYFRGSGAGASADNQPVGDNMGWGLSVPDEPVWQLDWLQNLKAEINAEGLQLEAIENFEPADWHDVLLDGPDKYVQIEKLKTIIKNVGAAGIPVFGYNFSLAGVGSRISGPYARGGAESVGMDGVDQTPIPKGMVWNMVYERHTGGGTVDNISHEELWSRLDWFLGEILPVAEASGVVMAAHPDDPPMPEVRSTPRLVYQPQMYQRLIDMYPSTSNKLEFCLGTIAEMTEGDVYTATEQYSRQDRIAYIHFRNIRGKVPHYRETFIDEGDIDMRKVLAILKKNNFDGVLIPDHTPLMACGAPWHAGMAYAMGYVKGLMERV
jgi:mannonate dehydratase